MGCGAGLEQRTDREEGVGDQSLRGSDRRQRYRAKSDGARERTFQTKSLSGRLERKGKSPRVSEETLREKEGEGGA